MKLEIIKDLEADSKKLEVGTIIEVSEKYAEELIKDGFAKEVKEIKEKVEIVKEVQKEIQESVKENKMQIENKEVSIEVGAEKLSPSKKLYNAMIVSKSLATGVWSEQSKKAIQGQGEAVAGDGGALVDDEIVSGIYANAVQAGQIFAKVQKKPVGVGNSALEIRQLNNSSLTASSFNGLAVTVVAEGADGGYQKLAYTTKRYAVNKLQVIVPATSEIIEDVPGLLAETETQVGGAFGMVLDNEILYGTQSLFTAAVGNAGSRGVTCATAATPTVAELHSMYMSQIDPARAEWYMSGAIYEKIQQLEDTEGSPVIVPNFSVSPFGTLLGRPVNVNLAMKGGDVAGTIGFCNWVDGYVVGTKRNITFAESAHLLFLSDQNLWKWVMRVAGGPTRAATSTLVDARVVSPLVFSAT